MQSRFPLARDEELERIAGVVGHTLAPNSYPLDKDIVNDPHRPHQDIHAYMPNLGPTRPFYNPELLSLCRLLREHYDDVCREYEALLQDNEEQQQDRFQSVTSMNYESGWKTFVLFYNGNRIPGFPYHLDTGRTRNAPLSTWGTLTRLQYHLRTRDQEIECLQRTSGLARGLL